MQATPDKWAAPTPSAPSFPHTQVAPPLSLSHPHDTAGVCSRYPDHSLACGPRQASGLHQPPPALPLPRTQVTPLPSPSHPQDTAAVPRTTPSRWLELGSRTRCCQVHVCPPLRCLSVFQPDCQPYQRDFRKVRIRWCSVLLTGEPLRSCPLDFLVRASARDASQNSQPMLNHCCCCRAAAATNGVDCGGRLGLGGACMTLVASRRRSRRNDAAAAEATPCAVQRPGQS